MRLPGSISCGSGTSSGREKERLRGVSRRDALALALAAGALSRKLPAAEPPAPIRLAVSESLVSEVNLNDARAAMQVWLERMSKDLNIPIEFSPKVFDATEEILRRARAGLFDAVALNVIEYRQIADLLDPSHVIAETDGEQYLLLAKTGGPVRHLSDLRGKRLTLLRAPRMCLARRWLATLLKDARLGEVDQFFASVNTDLKPSRVVLPVFFGQAEACITSRRGFETMSELNPQVARDLAVIAGSPDLVVTFYTFHKNYRGLSRERFAKVYADMPASVAGRQLAMLFQFHGLVVREVGCLAPALDILDASERTHRTGGVK